VPAGHSRHSSQEFRHDTPAPTHALDDMQIRNLAANTQKSYLPAGFLFRQTLPTLARITRTRRDPGLAAPPDQRTQARSEQSCNLLSAHCAFCTA